LKYNLEDSTGEYFTQSTVEGQVMLIIPITSIFLTLPFSRITV